MSKAKAGSSAWRSWLVADIIAGCNMQKWRGWLAAIILFSSNQPAINGWLFYFSMSVVAQLWLMAIRVCLMYIQCIIIISHTMAGRRLKARLAVGLFSRG